VLLTAGYCPHAKFDGISTLSKDSSGHAQWTGGTPGDGSQVSLVITGNGLLAGQWKFDLKTAGGSNWFVGTVLKKPDGTILKTLAITKIIGHPNGLKTVIFDAQQKGFPKGTTFIDVVFADKGSGKTFTDTITNFTVNSSVAQANPSQAAPIYYCLHTP
jgi:hypothetical protein